MKFSICIPNYNYENYIDETIDSVLLQDFIDFEIRISDNQSTDQSWALIQEFSRKDKRITAQQNVSNLGFAGNLDMAAGKAEGTWQLLVSSDDLMKPGALNHYDKFMRLVEKEVGPHSYIFGSNQDMIDSEGKLLSNQQVRKVWKKKDIHPQLSELMGAKVYRIRASELLERCLTDMQGAFNFVSLCYPTAYYHKAGGYGGSRMINPDKWFHFKLLMEVEWAYYLDETLFSYRWHQNNQTNLLKKSASLKFEVDEYRTSLEIPDSFLSKIGKDRQWLAGRFVEKVLINPGIRALQAGDKIHALRLKNLALATYPIDAIKNKHFLLLSLLSRLPIALSKYILKFFK